MKAWFAGLFFGAVLFLIDGQWIIARASLPGMSAGFPSIFLKNLVASLSTIYLGLALCYLELKIYSGISGETYAFMERLTEPLYRFLGSWRREFREVKPFYRSCLFYLTFVPNFSLFLNGIIPGFLLFFQPRLLLPHGIFEIPMMLASAKMAYSIKDEMEAAIISANIELLEDNMRKGVERGRLVKVVVIQSVLLLAAYVEVSCAF